MVESIEFPPKVVIDASLALNFLLPDEDDKLTKFLFRSFIKGKIEILVPEIFYFEVFNGLKSAVLKKRVNSRQAQGLLKNFLRFDLKEEKINLMKTFRLALKKDISFYDASYLSLAKEQKIPLLTLDKLLLRK